MIRTAGLMATLALIVPSAAQAVPMGIQDDGQSSMAVALNTEAIAGTWTRTTVAIGQPGVAQRIRDAHGAGLKIILTVGGTGTGPKDSATRKPTAKALLTYIRSLPRADKYTIINEPDLSGMSACSYRYRWMKVRHVLGERLLWGDFSPWKPLTYTAAASRCGPLPKHAGFAVHPYQTSDPLAPGIHEGSIGNLPWVRKVLRGMGMSTALWLTEFGYVHDTPKTEWNVSDENAGWFWPRAMRRATEVQARVLITYTSKGASWNSRPGELAWCSLTSGRACPGAEKPAEHREPVDNDDPPAVIRHMDPIVQQMLDYAK